MGGNLSVATLGGGCFWCLEAVFLRLQGVAEVVSGYCGGPGPNPSYREVCSGDSGHAEVVRIRFDPEQLSYRKLLEAFFAIHDPTTPDRQGNDVGSQYRSVIFCHSPEQEAQARALMRELEQAGSAPIVTQVLPEAPFFRAEAYHQDYFARNPGQPYCQFVVAPKVGKLARNFGNLLKGETRG
ncbi:MAG: peptide-methionine (S)-S-oxide reductase MsrA [Rhodocyclaceae bacterium]|nr:peptide-methionine (S)-S-oxide reductase MsrA [Rhodocyclaceae bacterium]